MATDPDPYFAFPKLVGAPAYARPPRVVPESDRPFDPDDLPIVAEMTDEERAFATGLQSSAILESGPQPGISPAHGSSSGSNGSGGSMPGSRFSLRALTGRRDARPK